jgi:hypothetical protein
VAQPIAMCDGLRSRGRGACVGRSTTCCGRGRSHGCLMLVAARHLTLST